MQRDRDTRPSVLEDPEFRQELEETRRRYIEHQNILTRLRESAPKEELAKKYDAIYADIEREIIRLEDLKHGRAPEPSSPAPLAPPVAGSKPKPPAAPQPWDTIRAGAQPVHTPPPDSGKRMFLIAATAVVILALLGLLFWRYDRSRDSAADASTETVSTATDATTVTEEASPQAPPVAAAFLAVEPAARDYGLVKKGTRVVRTFELRNETEGPLTPAIARSKCRCLWFDYPKSIPAGGKAALAISVDGAKAQKGRLQETIEISAKEAAGETATIDIEAVVE